MCRFGRPMKPEVDEKELKVSCISSPVTGAVEEVGIFTQKQIEATFGLELVEGVEVYENGIGERFKVEEV